jgi:RNA polymerase-binding protein DksA
MTPERPDGAAGPGPEADVDGVRAALLADRVATVARIQALGADVAAVVEAQSDVATDDEHDPEGATIAFERARVGALEEQGRRHLTDIDDALARLAAGDYGSCESCGADIAGERLSARPVARTCIDCAR